MLCQNYEIIFICRKDVEKMKKKEANRPYGETTGISFFSRCMSVGLMFGSADVSTNLFILLPALN